MLSRDKYAIPVYQPATAYLDTNSHGLVISNIPQQPRTATMKFGTFSAIILACTLSTGHMAHASWEITTDKAGMPMYKPESVQRHATREQHRPSRHHRQRDPFVPQHNDGYGIVTVSTQAGPIRVNAALAERFQSLVADLVAHGYKPHHIGCFARG